MNVALVSLENFFPLKNVRVKKILINAFDEMEIKLNSASCAQPKTDFELSRNEYETKQS